MNTTVILPIHRNGNKEWLQQAIQSFPEGTPYIVAENDGEVAEAVNEAVQQADTKFVLPFGADDVAQPDMLRYLESLIWDVDVAYPSCVSVDEKLKVLGYNGAEPFCPQRLLQHNFVTGGGSLVRRQSFLDAGGYRDLESLEDWDLWVRMMRQGYKFKPVPEARFLYRRYPGTRNQPDNYDETMDRLKAEIVGVTEPVPATFYYQATPAVTYWRCQVPSRGLGARCLPECRLVDTPDEFFLPDHEGAAIFQFPGDSTWALLGHALQHKGHRVLVETDDNYLVSSAQRKRAGWDVKIGKGMHSLEGHRRIVEHADGVIVTTETLGNQYRKVNPNVYVCPTLIDPDDWRWDKPDDGVLRVGWCASMSHADDGKLVARALEWCSRQPNVEVWTIGFDPGWKFPHVRVPWTNDLSTYRRMMFNLDIGVSPIVPNPWSVCRSDLKALEYTMAGACPVLSDEAPYDGWQDRVPVAKTGKDFLHILKDLVGNPAEAKRIAAEARKHVESERLVQHVDPWREAINGNA